MHLVMVCVGCSFNSFSIFLLSLNQQQNLMKIMFSNNIFKMYFVPVNCISVWADRYDIILPELGLVE